MAFSARARETQEAVYRATLGPAAGGGSGAPPKGKPGDGLSSFAALSGDNQGSCSGLVKTEEGCKVLRQGDKDRIGPCPACRKSCLTETFHTYERFFPAWKGKLDWPSGRLATCPTFKLMGASERGRLLEELKGCGACSSWVHSTEKCTMHTAPVCKVKEGTSECGGKHFGVLHGGGFYIAAGALLERGMAARSRNEVQPRQPEVFTVSSLSPKEGVEQVQSLGVARQPPTLLPQCGFLRHPALLATHVIKVLTSSGNMSINALSDEGSQITLVSQEAVYRLKLGPGVPWTMFLQVVGAQYREVQTRLYTRVLPKLHLGEI